MPGGNAMGMTTHGVSIQDEMASSVQSRRRSRPEGGQTSDSHAVVLEVKGVSKTFAGVTALRDVDFDLRGGEVHALMGENGAGKSTLMKILAGVHVDYEGEIRIEGAPVRFSGVQDAERAGVAIIHQELNLVPELTAAENIFLGREPLILGTLVDHRRIVKAASALLKRLGIEIDAQRRIAELRIGEQQLVEIAKALSLDARILIMDEPTSALDIGHQQDVLDLVDGLRRDHGLTVLATMHDLSIAGEYADRMVMLAGGRVVAAGTPGGRARSPITWHISSKRRSSGTP